jgi:hypothetical protein
VCRRPAGSPVRSPAVDVRGRAVHTSVHSLCTPGDTWSPDSGSGAGGPASSLVGAVFGRRGKGCGTGGATGSAYEPATIRPTRSDRDANSSIHSPATSRSSDLREPGVSGTAARGGWSTMSGPASAAAHRGPRRVSAMLVGVCALDPVPAPTQGPPGACARQTSPGHGGRSDGLPADDHLVPARAGPARVRAAPTSSAVGVPREQAHVPAEQPSPVQDPRLPAADAHPGRPRHPRRSPVQGSRQALRLRCCLRRHACAGGRSSPRWCGPAGVPGVPPWCCTTSLNDQPTRHGPSSAPGVRWTPRPGHGPVSWSAGPSATRSAGTG